MEFGPEQVDTEMVLSVLPRIGISFMVVICAVSRLEDGIRILTALTTMLLLFQFISVRHADEMPKRSSMPLHSKGK